MRREKSIALKCNEGKLANEWAKVGKKSAPVGVAALVAGSLTRRPLETMLVPASVL
jgi:hypothetical protein